MVFPHRTDVRLQDWIREFADVLRAKDGVEARHAVCLAQRVEIVRGKDLARWVKAHPEECSRFNKGRECDGVCFVGLCMEWGWVGRPTHGPALTRP